MVQVWGSLIFLNQQLGEGPWAELSYAFPDLYWDWLALFFETTQHALIATSHGQSCPARTLENLQWHLTLCYNSGFEVLCDFICVGSKLCFSTPAFQDMFPGSGDRKFWLFYTPPKTLGNRWRFSGPLCSAKLFHVTFPHSTLVQTPSQSGIVQTAQGPCYLAHRDKT